MTLLEDLDEYLHSYLEVSLFKDFCPNGLQVEGKNKIKKIATAVSANLATITQAVEHSVDALIVHHGLFWNKDPYPITATKRKKIKLLLENNISLFAYHLPLDAHREIGNNWRAAKDLGWEELEPFGQMDGNFIGVKGKLPTSSLEKFIDQLQKYYGHPAIAALGGKTPIASCALISGGAYRELITAAQEKVDCFITGNFDEPAWSIAHEEHIHFIALGHSATEKVGPIALAKHLQEKMSLQSFFLDIPNPF